MKVASSRTDCVIGDLEFSAKTTFFSDRRECVRGGFWIFYSLHALPDESRHACESVCEMHRVWSGPATTLGGLADRPGGAGADTHVFLSCR